MQIKTAEQNKQTITLQYTTIKKTYKHIILIDCVNTSICPAAYLSRSRR